ncbi:N-acyl homoserine lactonase family protein [Amycolatopsis jiangsuensis]|uniref:Glyoxylase-like metal-dependent hydrolase (Beta-lactamase superfamily II) n=1 Tax=Amycolatopsis jiangsuensis TaxID=1181879 RepID=A0A840IYN0_9PSEU|nr:N-acyl homoserine lactonase family protein [Amycolatopsis jiangsuensis]MBB4686803.1 glyoxylase-like metal-dependent hydrolase (beta-lactamase superfamily II) [Amycolatopsis jiangsuensis]
MSGYEVLAVKFGEWPTSKRTLYHSFDAYDEPDEPVRVDYYFWVVRNEQRTVVVDCGFRPEVADRRKRLLVTPVPEALRHVGVDPADVSHVVLTHFHYDHIGNLNLFPRSQVVTGAAEYAFWTGPIGARPLFAPAVEAEEVAWVQQAHREGRLLRVPVDDPALPGISFRPLPGHTPGQLVVEVEGAGDRRVVLASDASHTYEEFEQERPFHIASSLPDMYDGLAWLKQTAREAEVVPGHDNLVLTRYPAAEIAPEIAVRIS